MRNFLNHFSYIRAQGIIHCNVMSKLSKSKTWILLAFFALTGIIGGPLFVISCCCASETTSQSLIPTCHSSVSATITGKPACHGTGSTVKTDESAAHLTSRKTDSHRDSSHVAASNTEAQSFIGGNCRCLSHIGESPVATESNRAINTFAPVTLALPARPFVAEEALTVGRWMATQAHAPFSFLSLSLSGRAPPAC